MQILSIPIIIGQVVITSRFRTPSRPNHNGTDFAPVPRGENLPILAWDDGEIILLQKNNPSAGNWLEILHKNGQVTTYMHLDSINSEIKRGAKVTKGQQIGTMGTTGHSTGVHLHFEIRNTKERNGGRNAIDPEPIILNKNIRNINGGEEMKRFQTINEFSEGIRSELQNLIEMGALKGRDGKGNQLDLTENEARILVIAARIARIIASDSNYTNYAYVAE